MELVSKKQIEIKIVEDEVLNRARFLMNVLVSGLPADDKLVRPENVVRYLYTAAAAFEAAALVALAGAGEVPMQTKIGIGQVARAAVDKLLKEIDQPPPIIQPAERMP